MTAQITITINEDVATVKIVGKPTLQEILDTNKALMKNGRYICSRRFWDLRACLMDFSSEELEIIANFADHGEQNPSKIALLAMSDLTYGLSRMFQAFRQSENSTLSVFRDESEAMRWLLSDETPA